ncbi:MAG: CTP synthase [Chlamydiia bacterium]|nr:CTP synthase [Chlamydiia bacterium]
MHTNINLENKKIIFVTGGVMSGLGKGTLATSINVILSDMNINMLMQKADPYINLGAGFLSPHEHGEVFVCKDGTEADLDLGHYMRMTNAPLTKDSSFTTGLVYKEILEIEANGENMGKTIQVVPHVTDSIIRRVLNYIKNNSSYDGVIVEIGGTVGDIESSPFMESIRQLQSKYPNNVMVIHLSYVPQLSSTGEWKTKLTQHSVISLRSMGIKADVLVCRSTNNMPEGIANKISDTCSITKNNVICMSNYKSTIYELPLMLDENGLREPLAKFFNIESKSSSKLSNIRKIVEKHNKKDYTLNIGIVGKYVHMQESYKSLYEAIDHASIHLHYKINITQIFPEDINKMKKHIDASDGIIIPGGFGGRGWSGIKQAALYCFETDKPCLGICLGMQAMICSLLDKFVPSKRNYTSEEFVEDESESIWAIVKRIENTMRLGEKESRTVKATKFYEDNSITKEIFRHRYHASTAHLNKLIDKGIVEITANGVDCSTIDAIEASDKDKWFVGVQYHPELSSKPTKPRKIFSAFLEGTLEHKNKINKHA